MGLISAIENTISNAQKSFANNPVSKLPTIEKVGIIATPIILANPEVVIPAATTIGKSLIPKTAGGALLGITAVNALATSKTLRTAVENVATGKTGQEIGNLIENTPNKDKLAEYGTAALVGGAAVYGFDKAINAIKSKSSNSADQNLPTPPNENKTSSALPSTPQNNLVASMPSGMETTTQTKRRHYHRKKQEPMKINQSVRVNVVAGNTTKRFINNRFLQTKWT